MIEVRKVSLEDNLEEIVRLINQADWDDSNDMSTYDVASLSDYLQCQGTLFIVCQDIVSHRSTLLGVASARILVKPYDRERWMYVDEVDVCLDQRRRGIGTLIMQKFLQIATEKECVELWLGTELENVSANALYRALKPDEVDQVIGYTYKIDAALKNT